MRGSLGEICRPPFCQVPKSRQVSLLVHSGLLGSILGVGTVGLIATDKTDSYHRLGTKRVLRLSLRSKLIVELAWVPDYFAVDLFDNQLSNVHSWRQQECCRAEIDYFQCQRPIPTRMYGWGSEMN